jgi:hypothetical protein
MRNRLTVLGFAALLLLVWGTSHALPPSAGPSAPGDLLVAPSNSSDASGSAPFCPAKIAGPQAGLQAPDLPRNPVLKSYPCGACSFYSCQDVHPGYSCEYPDGPVFRLGRCIITSVCEEDNSYSCDCTSL